MVRVLSVHNFSKQEVAGVDEIIAAAVAPTQKLLLAQRNHRILISPLNSLEEESLPTVDQPISILHSTQGNYIATLEARDDVRFVRVYLGWATSTGATPLRARIAGRVTPLGQFIQGVEMLEIPTPAMPDCIAVCQFSGNLLVSSQGSLSVFKYTVQIHDQSRFEFVDFYKANWTVELGFSPDSIRICEDLIAAYNDRFLTVVRVTRGPGDSEISDARQVDGELNEHNGPILYNDLLVPCSKRNANFRSHEFPSVLAEPQLRNSPFIIYPEFSPQIIYDVGKEDTLKIVKLITLQLVSNLKESVRRDITDTFTCLQLKPYYCSNVSVAQRTVPVLGSPLYSSLKAVSCFIGTQQEGYLYHYLCNTEQTPMVSVYLFTAPLMDAVLEDSLLHALTEAGLETYTLRSPLCNTGLPVKNHDDPICLLGLRPFLHVRQLLLSESDLFLLANQDPENPDLAWTVYQLALANPAALWADFLSVADDNKWDAPSVYAHLVREANLMLLTRRESRQFHFDSNRGMKSLIMASNEQYLGIVDSLYKQSCAVLGDFHLLRGPHEEASMFFRLSELKLAEVVKRAEALFSGVPSAYRNEFDENNITLGLVNHAKECLRLEDNKYKIFGTNREEFFSPDIGNLVATVLDIMEKKDPASLSEVILASPVIQHFSSDRCSHILKGITNPNTVDILALVIMFLQKGQSEQGSNLLSNFNESDIEPVLLRHNHLLFEQSEALSELALALLKLKPKFMSAVFTTLTTQFNLLPFEKLQNAMKQTLQKSSGASSKNYIADVFESVLEKQLQNWAETGKSFSSVIQEAINNLAWLYLTRLSQHRDTKEEGVLDGFQDCRPKYLDHLPPFGPDFSQVLSPQHVATTVLEGNDTLRKMQVLLANPMARKSLPFVRAMLCKTPQVYGSLSIQVQCATHQEAIALLVNFAPNALLPFLKENNLGDNALVSLASLVDLVQNKMSSAQDPKRKFFYSNLMNQLFDYLARTLPMNLISDLIPENHPCRNRYLKAAYQSERAKKVRALTILTGNQLQ